MIIPYNIFNRYCLRTPLLSFSFLQDIYKKNSIEDEDYFELLKNKLFVEAIFLASPELHTQIKKWESGALKEQRKIEKLKISVLKYATRISTRCTPFGLFASCGIGEFSKETDIELNPIQDYKRITRFDMSFLSLLVTELLKDEGIKSQLRFYPNTSLYKVGNHYRYIEYTLKNNRRKYAIEGVTHSEYLENVLNFANQGKTILELARFLSNEEVAFEEADSFINELLKNQILVSEIELKVTGKDFFSDLMQRLSNQSEIREELVNLQLHLNTLDEKFGNSTKSYDEIIEKAKKSIPTLNKKHLLQTDSFTSYKNNTLEFKTKKQLKKAFKVFNKISSTHPNSNLEEFKRGFRKRYEDKEMPLHLVLDKEIGIGYGIKQSTGGYLIDDLVFGGTPQKNKNISWSGMDVLLFDKYAEAVKNSDYSIVLKEEDFVGFQENWKDLPDTFSGIAELYASNDGDKIFFNGISGSSATSLLGRFGHGNDEVLNHINEIVSVEDVLSTNNILAEIVHLPEARTGNVLQRPAMRKYEIPYLGNASVAKSCQIPIDDILVSMSGNRIVLKSKKLQKEILPRLGNAHNFRGSTLPLYHFLCELQTDNKRGSIGFHWNSIFLGKPFLPRVTFQNVIFSKAQWNIKSTEIKDLYRSKEPMEVIEMWRNKYRIPQYVALVEGDNKLLINLKNRTSIEMLIETIKKKKHFILEEFLFGEKEIVNSGWKPFCNQFVISFYNEAKLNTIKNG